MLRFFLLMIVAAGLIAPAFGADMPDGGPRRYRSPPPKDDTPDLLSAPSATIRSMIEFPPTALVGGPILLGSATLPGYYGSNHSYHYQGPYYGRPDESFRTRLPYACGVLGYC